MMLSRSFFKSSHNAVFIFDKDGTLIDTESLYFEAFNRMLNVFGHAHDLPTHIRMMGASADTCLGILRERHTNFPQGDETLPELRAELLMRVSEVRRERGTKAMPGATSFLANCHEQGIRLAMATSATRENTDRDLASLGWERYFEAVVTSDDVTRHKPAPDVFLEAAKRMNASPSGCIAFEDGLRGVQSAHTAGMRIVFVRDERFGITPPPEADLVVANFSDLLI